MINPGGRKPGENQTLKMAVFSCWNESRSVSSLNTGNGVVHSVQHKSKIVEKADAANASHRKRWTLVAAEVETVATKRPRWRQATGCRVSLDTHRAGLQLEDSGARKKGEETFSFNGPDKEKEYDAQREQKPPRRLVEFPVGNCRHRRYTPTWLWVLPRLLVPPFGWPLWPRWLLFRRFVRYTKRLVGADETRRETKNQFDYFHLPPSSGCRFYYAFMCTSKFFIADIPYFTKVISLRPPIFVCNWINISWKNEILLE